MITRSNGLRIIALLLVAYGSYTTWLSFSSQSVWCFSVVSRVFRRGRWPVFLKSVVAIFCLSCGRLHRHRMGDLCGYDGARWLALRCTGHPVRHCPRRSSCHCLRRLHFVRAQAFPQWATENLTSVRADPSSAPLALTGAAQQVVRAQQGHAF